jgi:predicted RNA methylase
MEREASRPLDLLDLGAGTGWMSYRLALRGHHPVAVDLLNDDRDGLGAARHFFAKLPREFRACKRNSTSFHFRAHDSTR